jgi:hypothetical protein
LVSHLDVCEPSSACGSSDSAASRMQHLVAAPSARRNRSEACSRCGSLSVSSDLHCAESGRASTCVARVRHSESGSVSDEPSALRCGTLSATRGAHRAGEDSRTTHADRQITAVVATDTVQVQHPAHRLTAAVDVVLLRILLLSPRKGSDRRRHRQRKRIQSACSRGVSECPKPFQPLVLFAVAGVSRMSERRSRDLRAREGQATCVYSSSNGDKHAKIRLRVYHASLRTLTASSKCVQALSIGIQS